VQGCVLPGQQAHNPSMAANQNAVAGLRDDPVPRVRAAAQRAVVTLTAEKS